MASITTKLNYLKETKDKIKEALKSKGAVITTDTPFRDYVEMIKNLTGDPADDGLGDDIMKLDSINGELYFKTYNYTDEINKINGEVI